MSPIPKIPVQSDYTEIVKNLKEKWNHTVPKSAMGHSSVTNSLFAVAEAKEKIKVEIHRNVEESRAKNNLTSSLIRKLVNSKKK